MAREICVLQVLGSKLFCILMGVLMHKKTQEIELYSYLGLILTYRLTILREYLYCILMLL